MKYFMDSEFIDDGKTIALISIGIVAEDGREYYAQSMEFDASKASEWVAENVLYHLIQCDGGTRFHHDMNARIGQQCMGRKFGCTWRSRAEIKQEILAFMDTEKYGYPELVGWCSGYDFVVFCQLFGTMMNVPRFIPHYMQDVQQVLDEKDITDDMLPPQEGQTHNALADAKYIKKLWGWLHR